jgi:two-component system response regulator LytT
MIKFAICDDEPAMARELAGYLARYLEEHEVTAYSVSSFSSGRALLEAADGFDVIFLDIQMEEPDGMETARLLRGQGDHSLLVFVTVLMELVFDAFQVEAYDYLTKPLDAARFARTMDRVLQTLEQRTAASIVIQQGSGCEVVPLSDVVYCEVLGRKVYLHKADGTITGYYDRLEQLERRVDGRFFRCHRSYLVNLDHVRGCQAGQVLLSQGERIPVSRLRERDLTGALLLHMKKRDSGR